MGLHDAVYFQQEQKQKGRGQLEREGNGRGTGDDEVVSANGKRSTDVYCCTTGNFAGDSTTHSTKTKHHNMTDYSNKSV